MTRSITAIPLEKSYFNVPFAHRGLHDCDGNFGFGRRPFGRFSSLLHSSIIVRWHSESWRATLNNSVQFSDNQSDYEVKIKRKDPNGAFV
jgi:hypothetical protein